MKRFIKISLIIGFFLIFLGRYNYMYSQEVLNLATSAQIADAFGVDVVKEFEAKHNIKVNVFICSSNTALQRLVNGFSDIACVAFKLPARYREQGYVEIPFARDPLVIIVNSSNNIKNLSVFQIKQIFSGQVRNWVALKGLGGNIYRVVPNRRTALYNNFKLLVMQQLPIDWDFQSYLSINVIMLVKNLKGSIGFISNGAIKDKKGIKKLLVDGFKVGDKNYPYYQVFSFVTKGIPKRNAKEFINAALSKRGREIIISKGMNPIF